MIIFLSSSPTMIMQLLPHTIGDRRISGAEFNEERLFPASILVKYMQPKRNCKELFGMNISHVFGGALINTSVTPVSESTPHDPQVDPAIASFLAVMAKAYACGMESQFRLVQEIFLDEMDTLIDDKRLSQQPLEVPCLFDLLTTKKKEEK
jgi:hypothetical protein